MALYDEIYFPGNAPILAEPLHEDRERVRHAWKHIAWQDAYAYLGECLAASGELRQIASIAQVDDGHLLEQQLTRSN